MDVICRGQCRMKTWASFTKYSEFPDGDHRGGSKGNSDVVPVKPVPRGLHLLPPSSITRDGPAHPRPPGRDPNSKFKVRSLPSMHPTSKFKVQSLLSMHHLHAIINLKNPQFNHPKSGTACTCHGGCKKDQGPGGSAGGAPRRRAGLGMQKRRCGKGVGLRELMHWAVGSEGTKVLEFCLMFVFGEAVSDPAGVWTAGQMHLSEQMPFCPLTQV